MMKLHPIQSPRLNPVNLPANPARQLASSPMPVTFRAALLPGMLSILLNLALADPATAAWQCQQNGKTVYQDAPCENGKVIAPASAPDAANLQEAKQRAARDKAQLAKIEATKAREEALAAKQAALAAKQAQRKQMMEDRRAAQCQRARQQQKWAEQDVASATPKQLTKARRKALRAQEKTQLLCPAR